MRRICISLWVSKREISSINCLNRLKHRASHSIWLVTVLQSSPMDVYEATLLYHTIIDFGPTSLGNDIDILASFVQ